MKQLFTSAWSAQDELFDNFKELEAPIGLPPRETSSLLQFGVNQLQELPPEVDPAPVTKSSKEQALQNLIIAIHRWINERDDGAVETFATLLMTSPHQIVREFAQCALNQTQSDYGQFILDATRKINSPTIDYGVTALEVDRDDPLIATCLASEVCSGGWTGLRAAVTLAGTSYEPALRALTGNLISELNTNPTTNRDLVKMSYLLLVLSRSSYSEANKHIHRARKEHPVFKFDIASSGGIIPVLREENNKPTAASMLVDLMMQGETWRIRCSAFNALEGTTDKDAAWLRACEVKIRRIMDGSVSLSDGAEFTAGRNDPRVIKRLLGVVLNSCSKQDPAPAHRVAGVLQGTSDQNTVNTLLTFLESGLSQNPRERKRNITPVLIALAKSEDFRVKSALVNALRVGIDHNEYRLTTYALDACSGLDSSEVRAQLFRLITKMANPNSIALALTEPLSNAVTQQLSFSASKDFRASVEHLTRCSFLQTAWRLASYRDDPPQFFGTFTSRIISCIGLILNHWAVIQSFREKVLNRKTAVKVDENGAGAQNAK